MYVLRRSSLDPSQRGMVRATEFLAKASVLAAPMYALFFFADMAPIQGAVASQVSLLLQAMGFSVLQEGSTLTVEQSFRFAIIPWCTGLNSMFMFAALVIAAGGREFRKIGMGLAIGLPFLWIANIARIVGVVIAQGWWGTGVALVLHDLFFQPVLALTVLASWAFWLLWSWGRLRIRAPWRPR
jgi:exosortase/archaeosortase family protein